MTLQFDSSGASHFYQANQRFESAEKDGAGLAFPLARNVEAIVIAVDEINVGVAGRAEQDGGAGGVAGGGVGRGIALSEVGLNFDDAGRQERLLAVTHQDLAEKFAGHAPRIAGEEGAGERQDRFGTGVRDYG